MFRNDLHAMRERAEKLERELAQLRESREGNREQLAALEERLAEARATIAELRNDVRKPTHPRRASRNTKLHATVALVVAAAVGGLVFVFVQIGGSSDRGVNVGARSAVACTERAPDCMPKLAMTDREGIEWTPIDFENKVVIVNVWATWCEPCKRELPELVELRRHYSDQDVLLLGILTDEPGDAVVQSFVTTYGVNYPIIPITGAIDEAFASPSRLPTTFVYDRSGHLAHEKTGAVTMSGMRRVIDGLL